MRRAAWVVLMIALVLAVPSVVFAQSPSPASDGPNVFGNMPGIVYLVIPLAIAGAIYLSRELGRDVEDAEPDRRVGAVSRALAHQKPGGVGVPPTEKEED